MLSDPGQTRISAESHQQETDIPVMDIAFLVNLLVDEGLPE